MFVSIAAGSISGGVVILLIIIALLVIILTLNKCFKYNQKTTNMTDNVAYTGNST